MNLSQIEAFCSVAELGSVSEAARHLDCNRTKLSMSIKSLEKELDIELLPVQAINSLFLKRVKPSLKTARIYWLRRSELSKPASKSLVSLTPRCGSHETIHYPMKFGKNTRMN